MKIEDVLLEKDIKAKVEKLKKGRTTDQPAIDKIKKHWNPKDHEIFNEATRPNKTVYYAARDANGDPTDKTLSRTELVARVPMSIQKLIVKRAASFLFGNSVKTIASDEKSKVAEAVNRILRDNKQDSLNRKVARTLFASTEVAEYWYPVTAKEKFSTYGFETDIKIKSTIFSPLNGDVLYPFFDETGNMTAFSREYKIKDVEGKEITYFETWTDEQYFRFKQGQNGWEDALEGTPTPMQLGKIPIVYAQQEAVEWDDVQWLIERLEKLVSNFGDTNDYHGAPKIAVSGQVKGFASKGDSGGILEMEEGASAQYLAWQQAPESVKLEFENLLRMIYSLTQTPDISFEAVKGLGSAASGESLKMLFLDAHLKVMDKMEIFDDYLQRRLNILKAFVGTINTQLKADADKLELSAQVIPYMVNDEKGKIDNLVTATTGGIMSKQTAVAQNPLVEDSEKEIQLLKTEKEEENASAEGLDNIQNE